MENKIHYLYKITCLINGKIYIGQTVQPSKRWHQHRWAAANPKQVIAFAIKKYGAHNFKFETLACSRTKENSDYCETLLIEQYNSRNKGYNIQIGGIKNTPCQEVTKKKIKKANRKIYAKKYFKFENKFL